MTFFKLFFKSSPFSQSRVQNFLSYPQVCRRYLQQLRQRLVKSSGVQGIIGRGGLDQSFLSGGLEQAVKQYGLSLPGFGL